MNLMGSASVEGRLEGEAVPLSAWVPGTSFSFHLRQRGFVELIKPAETTCLSC
jgi:hypothetical protein